MAEECGLPWDPWKPVEVVEQKSAMTGATLQGNLCQSDSLRETEVLDHNGDRGNKK